MQLFQSNKLFSFVRRHALMSFPFLTVAKLANIALASIEMIFRKKRCLSRPFVYRIDPCTACNIRCPNCEAHSQKTNEKRLMSLNVYHRLIDKVQSFAVKVSLYDTGEPLMNKNIYKMIAYANSLKISTSMSTNLNLFDPVKDLEPLFASGLNVIQPDVDGVTQESYSRYRVGGSVDIVKRGIESITARKQITGSKYPVVDAQVLAFEHLVPEKLAIDNYLNSVNVDSITWKEDSWGFNPARDIKAVKPKARCFWLYTAMMIRPDGKVYPCCGRGFNRKQYGDLLEQSIDEIWNSAAYQFSRQLFTRGDDLPYQAEMRDIPCLTCKEFQKVRTMAPAPTYTDNLIASSA